MWIEAVGLREVKVVSVVVKLESGRASALGLRVSLWFLIRCSLLILPCLYIVMTYKCR